MPAPKGWVELVWPLHGFWGWMNPDGGCCWCFSWCSKFEGEVGLLNELRVGGPIMSKRALWPIFGWPVGFLDEKGEDAIGEVAWKKRNTKNLKKCIIAIFDRLCSTILSEVDMLENIVNASGKFGGVAGVLAGVINCKKKLL